MEALLQMENTFNSSHKIGAIGGSATDWRLASFDDLVDYIVNTHHDYLYNELPKIGDLTTKILRVHGRSHPELAKVHKLFHTLKLELEQHLIKEEQTLFPRIIDYEEDPSLDKLNELLEVIEELEAEDIGTGDFLKELSAITKGYAIPGDVCSTFSLTYQKLKNLELDLFTHIQLENNVLFPRLKSQQ
jgi:regulator of cell morphogenesis and NO signaling